jgi:hypothetical protein
MYRRNMSDEELRRLERQASSGEPEALDRLNHYRQRHGLPLIPRVLPAPVEPYEWADKVSAWLDQGSVNQPSFLMTLGAYRDTLIVVRNSSAEEAIAALAGWAADNAPEYLVEPEYELDEDGNCSECGQDPTYDQCEHVADAEVDLTYTDYGWLTWEWGMDELELEKTLVSALSRALPYCESSEDIEGYEEGIFEPIIAFGSFWHLPRRGYYYPSSLSEDQVRAAFAVRRPDSEALITAPEEGIYVCWAEDDDDPLGEDAITYAPAWSRADRPFWERNQNDNYRWISGARTLLREVNYFRGAE